MIQWGRPWFGGMDRGFSSPWSLLRVVAGALLLVHYVPVDFNCNPTAFNVPEFIGFAVFVCDPVYIHCFCCPAIGGCNRGKRVDACPILYLLHSHHFLSLPACGLCFLWLYLSILCKMRQYRNLAQDSYWHLVQDSALCYCAVCDMISSR